MKYQEREFKEFDGNFPIYCTRYDQYFFSADEVEDFINDFEDENGQPSEPQFQFLTCKPNYLKEIDFNDIWCDLLPENYDCINDVASNDLITAIDSLNEIIKNHKPVSYSSTKYRTAY